MRFHTTITIRVSRSLIFACLLAMLSATAHAQSGGSYLTYYFSENGTRVYATTVTYGSMPTNEPLHKYTAYTMITSPSGYQGVGCGSVETGYVPAYATVQASCYMDLTESGTYLLSSRGIVFCLAVMRSLYDVLRPPEPIYIRVSQSPATLNLSTGDNANSGTAKYINTTVTPSSIHYTPAFSWGLSQNPNSNCAANLGFSNASGTGSVSTMVTAGVDNCSGVFNATAVVGQAVSSSATQIVVPPQVLIRFLRGEAGGQTGAGDASQQAIGSCARNRFGDSAFPGGSTSTYQAVITSSQFYGASNSTANGHEPELTNAVRLFTWTTGDIVANAKCYWSPTADQWTLLQNALSSGTTVFPPNVGAPACWVGQRQAVYKTSAAGSTRGGVYAGAPAFVFLSQSSANQPAVVQIP